MLHRSIKRFSSIAEQIAPRNNALIESKYRIMAGAILRRNPLTLRAPSEFQKAYEDYREVIQAEYSRGVFDIMTPHKQELLRMESGEKGTQAKVRNDRPVVLSEELHERYQLAEKNPRSLMRKLDRKLYLVVQDELGGWRFPSWPVASSETPIHRLVAQNLSDLLGINSVESDQDPTSRGEIYLAGFSPVAYSLEKYNDRTAPPFGDKTFLLKAQLVAGRFIFKPFWPGQAYAWLCHEELKEALSASYFDHVSHAFSY